MSLAPVTERESTSSDHYILGPNTTAIWTVAMDMVDAACEDGVVRHLAIRNREQDYSPLVARLSLCLLLILRPHFAVGNRPARDGPQAPIVRRCFSNRNMLWLSGDRCVRHPREAKQKKETGFHQSPPWPNRPGYGFMLSPPGLSVDLPSLAMLRERIGQSAVPGGGCPLIVTVSVPAMTA